MGELFLKILLVASCLCLLVGLEALGTHNRPETHCGRGHTDDYSPPGRASGRSSGQRLDLLSPVEHAGQRLDCHQAVVRVEHAVPLLGHGRRRFTAFVAARNRHVFGFPGMV